MGAWLSSCGEEPGHRCGNGVCSAPDQGEDLSSPAAARFESGTGRSPSTNSQPAFMRTGITTAAATNKKQLTLAQKYSHEDLRYMMALQSFRAAYAAPPAYAAPAPESKDRMGGSVASLLATQEDTGVFFNNLIVPGSYSAPVPPPGAKVFPTSPDIHRGSHLFYHASNYAPPGAGPQQFSSSYGGGAAGGGGNYSFNMGAVSVPNPASLGGGSTAVEKINNCGGWSPGMERFSPGMEFRSSDFRSPGGGGVSNSTSGLFAPMPDFVQHDSAAGKAEQRRSLRSRTPGRSANSVAVIYAPDAGAAVTSSTK